MEFINGIFAPAVLAARLAERFPDFRFSIESIDHPLGGDGVARAVKVTSPDLFNEVEVSLFVEAQAYESVLAAKDAIAGARVEGQRVAVLAQETRATLQDDPRDILFFGQTNTDEMGVGVPLPFGGNGYQTVPGMIDKFNASISLPTGGTYRVQLRISIAFDGLNKQDGHDPVYVWVARNAKPASISETRYTKLPLLVFNPAGKLDINVPLLQTDDSVVTLGAGDRLDVRYATTNKTPSLYAMYIRDLIVERIGA